MNTLTVNVTPKAKPKKEAKWVYPKKEREFSHEKNNSDQLDKRSADDILTDLFGIVNHVYDQDMYRTLCISCLRMLHNEQWSKSGLPQLLRDTKYKLKSLDRQTLENAKKQIPNFLKVIEKIPLNKDFAVKYSQTVDHHNRIIRGEIEK